MIGGTVGDIDGAVGDTDGAGGSRSVVGGWDGDLLVSGMIVIGGRGESLAGDVGGMLRSATFRSC